MLSFDAMVVVPEDAPAGAYARVYGDAGMGTIDYTNPLSGNLYVPDETGPHLWATVGWASAPWAGHGGSRSGWAELPWASADHARAQRVVRWRSPESYGTTLKFSVRLYDKDGRLSGSAPPEVTRIIQTAPRPASNLQLISQAGGFYTFSFIGSPDLV